MPASGLGRGYFVLAIAWLGWPLTVSPLLAQQLPAPVKSINENLATQWQEQGLTPAGRCTDFEFLRRVSLDLLGRIPTLEECLGYEQDARSDKRKRLVERLQGSADHAEHWARLWTSWLLGDTPPARHAEPLHAWLREQTVRSVSHLDLTNQLLTATGRSDDNPAVHFLAAQLGQPLPADKLREDGQLDMVPITGRAIWLFLGWQLQCTECHDHAFNADFKQRHFWGINAYFRQLERKPLAGKAEVFELRDNPEFNRAGRIFYQDGCGRIQATGARFVDGRRIPDGATLARRQELVKCITADPQFAKAFVNRLWGHFFGRGLNAHPDVADFGEHNEVVHADLLDQLAQDFVAVRYDTRQLVRWICASDAYQLQCTQNLTNSAPETEVYFSRKPLRNMTYDQLVRSVQTALRLPAADEKQRLDQWRQQVFLKPQPPLMNDRGFDEPTPDAWMRMLFLMNNRQLDAAIRDAQSGPLTPALRNRTPEQIIDMLCLTVLTRRASAREQAALAAEVRKLGPKPKAADLVPLWQDLLWALLNSNEFVLQH